MLILKFKQAESALDDGRLDEAFELARDEEFRSHRRGQEIVSRLVEGLVGRGGEHLEAGRVEQAQADAARAQQLGGNQPETMELLAGITEALAQQLQRQQRKAAHLTEAREQVAEGRLSAAEQLLTGSGAAGTEAALLLRTAERRRAELESLAQQGRESLAREDFAGAIGALLQAGGAAKNHRQLAELRADVLGGACRRARGHFQNGRLDLGEALLETTAAAGGETLELTELRRVQGLCRRAAGALERGRARAALEALRQLQTLLPEAGWAVEAAAACAQAAERLETLGSGPLGLLRSEAKEGESAAAGGRATAPVRSAGRQAVPEAGGGGGQERLPESFLLRVDGVGSFLVLRQERVSIGPVSSSRRCEIALLADPNLPTITVERTEGDYFVRGMALSVNDEATSERLLNHEDRVGLGERCRFRFQRPNPASGSASLVFSSGRLAQGDVRQVILLDREILIGSGAAAHVRAERAEGSAALYVRDGRLWCRGGQGARADGKSPGAAAELPLERPIRVGGLSLAISKSNLG